MFIDLGRLVVSSIMLRFVYKGSEEVVGNGGGGNVGRVRREHDEALVDALGLQARHRVAASGRAIEIKGAAARSQQIDHA